LLFGLLRSHAQPAATLRIGIRDDPDLLDPTSSRTYAGTVVMTALCDKVNHPPGSEAPVHRGGVRRAVEAAAGGLRP
jgi:hypothetical protein